MLLAVRKKTLKLFLKACLFVVVPFGALEFVALVLYDESQPSFWTAWTDFEVRLKSEHGRQVQKLSFDTLLEKGWADDFRKDPSSCNVAFTPVKDFDGTRGTVFIRTSQVYTGLWHDCGSQRAELVVLEVVYADGEKRLELAEVPERGQPQVISVTIP